MLEDGSRFGRYLIVGALGKGGMGLVYRAHDTVLRRDVAIKILHDGSRSGPGRTPGETTALLLREARAAAALSHPNAVSVFDVGDVDGTGYLAMEIVIGHPMRAYVGDPSVSPERRRRWIVALAEVLDAAHQAGLVHRDIKPENILVQPDDSIKVLDFGIARRFEGGEALELRDGPPRSEEGVTVQTRDSRVRGTPGYIAPEVLAGAVADARSDQFAWGVVAYELFVGVTPARSDGDHGLLSPAVRPTILRALLPRPESRFASMRAVAIALGGSRVDARAPTSTVPPVPAALDVTATTASMGTPRSPSRERAPRGATWPTLLGVAGAVALVGTLFASRGARPSPTSVPPPAPAQDPAAGASMDTAATPPIEFHPKHVRRVTFGDSCEEFPSFTPDGKSIIYDSTIGADSFLFEMSVADGSTRQITTTGHGWDMAAAISPDGERLAYLRMDDRMLGTFLVDRAGKSAPRLLTAGLVRPSWSPDGRSVWAGEPHRLEKRDADTGALVGSLPVPASMLPWHVNELGPDASSSTCAPIRRKEASVSRS